ncbi:ecotin family protein [Flavobacterium sp. HSC-61S13]|uniref:ecotin family protein n=1 Tax=Flavobacterium sp. HSC-61S13 TaxID=2910963 RepID=UPI00209ED7E9|nr:ecotin family protein [Flavobacterium sp. HSC-61S13]MCP1995035.1 ecotin [Flavobacterium sp. HSC-61S13]
MKKKSQLLILTIILAVSSAVAAQEKSKTEMFPKAKEGFKQVVINLPKIKKEENNYKIELFVGKIASTDSCNSYSLIGELTDHNLEGWGYTYYNFDSEGRILKTLMMCPDDTKVNTFVHDQGTFMRYNSNLPIVVYVADGLEVRYKVWKTDGKWMNKEVKSKK